MNEERSRALIALAARRWRIALVLTGLMLATYFGFVLLVAYDKPLLGTILVPGLSLGIVLGIVVILVVAFMVGLAFAIAASANFPALLLSMTWSRFSTAGAVSSMLVGTISAIVLICLSPTIQIDLLHHGRATFPLKNPGIVTMTLSFALGIIASLLRPDPDAARTFAAVERRIQLGARGDDGQP